MTSAQLQPIPSLTPEDVRTAVSDLWGLPASVSVDELGSLLDGNYRVSTGDREFVFKVAGSDEEADLDLQNRAMAWVAQAGLPLVTPTAVPSRRGNAIERFAGRLVRLLTWVPGASLRQSRAVDLSDFRELGRVAGELSGALAGFEHERLDRPNVWNCLHTLEVIDEIAGDLDPGDFRNALVDAVAPLRACRDLLGEVPLVVAHADVNEDNIAFAGVGRASGAFDFGDVMRTPRIGDIAAAAMASVSHPLATWHPLEGVAATLAGYASVTPLEAEEIELLWPLLRARIALCWAIDYVQSGWDPGTSARQESEQGRQALQQLASVPPALATAHLRAVVGLDPRPASGVAQEWIRDAVRSPVIPHVDGAAWPRLDLGVQSDLFTADEWSSTAALDGLVEHERVAAGGRVLGCWGERRLVGPPRPDRTGPATVRLGADLFVEPGVEVLCPVPAAVERVAAEVVLLRLPIEPPMYLRFGGIEPNLHLGQELPAGTMIGRAGSGGRVAVQLQAEPDAPEFGEPALSDGWLAVCPDPSALLGTDAAAPPPVEPAAARRDRERTVSRVQQLYYRRPPQIVRGWRHFLYDDDGRPYVDMINNIASVGHSHPRVTAAATRQLRRLNTNSRFLYPQLTRFADRFAEFLPAELDTVLLTNTGSEAVELALHLARTCTGRKDLISLEGAYHGWTRSVLDLSTSTVDRPNWRDELEPQVHVARQPNPYRLAGDEDPAVFLSSLEAAVAAAERRGGPAAFVAEPLLGCQGGVEPPPGYLEAAYAAVRAAGGLCIADEVQVGLGRTGETFWAFQHENVVPDILCVAKAAGNGYPLGVVATRREIADAFGARASSFFSSTAGSPVASEIGRVVLDVIAEEGLQDNARKIGAHLRQAFLVLAERHELIGAVHGRGLYQGVELVEDRESRRPAASAAAAVCEAMRPLGVILQPTGDAMNVLKVKPPLCLDRAAADHVVAVLDEALALVGDRG